jgi:signal transduction histidine kinase
MPRKSLRPKTEHTILIVDDQEETLNSVRSLLTREGHRTLTAQSGKQALDLLARHDVHLLLVDYFMPHMTGEQLIREIRRFDPYVPIILQTEYAGEKPRRVVLSELNIQGYHDKADGPERLLLWVDVGLQAHRLINRLRERERLQHELVANVSHELRTPLNIIGGYTGLLLEESYGALPPPVVYTLQRIETATANLGELVEDFLKYAKTQAGVTSLTETRIETQELAQELRRLGTLLSDEKDIAFTLDIDDAPPYFVADWVKLRTVLRNLIGNAIKFTAKGSVVVRVAAEGETLRFSVKDTGLGIPLDSQEVIFEPFRQLNGSPSRRHPGIGLGLALSRKFAHLMGGNIELQSQPGAGSTFALVIPGGPKDRRPAVAASPADGGETANVALAAAMRCA